VPFRLWRDGWDRPATKADFVDANDSERLAALQAALKALDELILLAQEADRRNKARSIVRAEPLTVAGMARFRALNDTVCRACVLSDIPKPTVEPPTGRMRPEGFTGLRFLVVSKPTVEPRTGRMRTPGSASRQFEVRYAPRPAPGWLESIRELRMRLEAANDTLKEAVKPQRGIESVGETKRGSNGGHGLSRSEAIASRLDVSGGFLGGVALADALGIHPSRRSAFFRQLERGRKSLGDACWLEVSNPQPNSPRFLYRADSRELLELAAPYKKPRPA
jgi:hypothetical protein